MLESSRGLVAAVGVAVTPTTRAESNESPCDRVLIFLSDLHLATDPGKHDFFAQAELTALLDEALAREEPVDVIFNGDFFDLLQLTGSDRLAAFRETLEQPANRELLARLRLVTASDRHQCIYLIGNHDSEVGWNDDVRRYLLDAGLVNRIELAYAYTYRATDGNGCFVYAEHGNEYDGVNAVGDYRNPAVTPLGAHIVTDLVNYLEPLGRHASIDAPTSIADVDNIHPLGFIPWWLISTYFYSQVRRVVKYIVVPALVLYGFFHLLPVYLLLERYRGSVLARGLQSLPDAPFVFALLVIAFDSSLLLIFLVWLLVRYDFARTRRRYGLQDPDDILRRGARHYRRTCESLVSGRLRPAFWPVDTPWEGADLFVYGHTHEEDLTLNEDSDTVRAYANTGTWTRKVIRLQTHFRLPPVFIPIFSLSYVVVERTGDRMRVRLWVQPKELTYRLPWTERLATLGRRRPAQRPPSLAPQILKEVSIPFRPRPPMAEPAPHIFASAPWLQVVHQPAEPAPRIAIASPREL